MKAADFRPPYAVIFREAFEGIKPGANGTWFVQGKEGLFDALATVSAERASIKPNAGCPTIAAHAYHILFALQSGNSYIGRPAPTGTWETSWEKQTVNEAEWAALADKIRDEYEFCLKWAETNEDWSNAEVLTGAFGQLAHMAFHLGAIRALMKVV